MPTLNIHLIHNSHSPYFSDVWSRYITELIPPEKIVIYRDPVHWERSVVVTAKESGRLDINGAILIFCKGG